MSAGRRGVVAAGFTFAAQSAPRVLLPDPTGLLTTHLAQQGRDQGEGQGTPAAHDAPPTRSLSGGPPALFQEKQQLGDAREGVRSEQRGQAVRLCRAGTTRTPFSWGPARLGPGRGFLDRARRLRQLGMCEEQGSLGEIVPGEATFGFPPLFFQSTSGSGSSASWFFFLMRLRRKKKKEREGEIEKASR